MASGLCCHWTCLWTVTLFTGVFAGSASLLRYSLSPYQATFDEALQDCAPGFLTSFVTKQEINEILKLISGSPQNDFIFWVGLKKDKKECVHAQRPLRGFKWSESGSEDAEEAFWAEEPQSTCTSALCAAVKAEFDGSKVTRWGLISVSCRSRYRFICKLRDGLTGQTPEHRETSTNLDTPEPTPVTPEPNTDTSETPDTEQGGPGTGLTIQLEPETVHKPTTGPKQVGPDHAIGSGPAPGSVSCKHPIVPQSRYLRPDPDNRRIWVECWSNDQLTLYCRGQPAMWHLPDNSPANFTALCQRCRVGFQKDASANCVDIDECSNGHARCRHTCLNTEGSYRCICPDGTGKPHHEEDSSACTDSVTVEDSGLLSGILIPVLVAVVTLMVLVVVVVVTVKCCLMRRLKKKKEKNVVMRNKDSKETFAIANEKTET